MVTTANPCKAKNRKGQPCKGYANESGYCFSHDPARSGQRKAARSKGGKARHGRNLTEDYEPIALASVDDILGIVERAINDCLRLENSLQRARTIGYLAGVAIKSFEVSELEQRLSALEERLNEQQFRTTNNPTGKRDRAGPA